MGTITIPDPLPSPTQDCQSLHKAFEGWGTDEKTIIDILGHRNADQRKKISRTYQQLYNQSLIDALKSELSGDFGRAVIWWTMDPPERDAKLIRESLRKKGVKHLFVIVEVACASSPHHLIAVRQAYCAEYNCSLEEDISLYVAQPMRKLLVRLVSSYRFDGQELDVMIATSEAAKLHEAIEKRRLDDDHFIGIVSIRNKFQLKETFSYYKQVYGTPIDQDIQNCGSSDLTVLSKTAVWCIDTPEKHFAEVVRKSILGLGTDEDSLSRAIVTRAEIDLAKVKEEYQKAYKNTLLDDVVGDTSGDYMNFLVALIGNVKV